MKIYREILKNMNSTLKVIVFFSYKKFGIFILHSKQPEVLLEKYKKAKRDALVLVKIIGCIVVG